MSDKNLEESALTPDHSNEPGRRRILTASALFAAGGLLSKPSSTKAAGGRGGALVVDCACLGHTFGPNLNGALNPPVDLRGGNFYVEGALYPAGTIPSGPGFDPASAESIGHWFCRGWFMGSPDRDAPHAITTQEYFLSVITPEELSPEDTLVSSGVEGGGTHFNRAVVGGSGRYSDARGNVLQETIGSNTTILNVFQFNAPNFRFYFSFNG